MMEAHSSMTISNRREPRSLADCEAILGKRERKKLARNTYLERRENGFAVRYHATDVATWTKTGLVLDSGGYRTVTTRERINWALPMDVSLSQTRGVWSVTDARFD